MKAFARHMHNDGDREEDEEDPEAEKEECPIRPVFYDWIHGFPVGDAFLVASEIQDKSRLDGL